jgi:hypothetical protein
MKNGAFKFLVVASVALIQGCSTGVRKPAATADASNNSPVTPAAPAATTPPFVVSNSILAEQLHAALSLLKDPAVSAPADGHVILTVGQHTVDCFSGIVKDAGGGNAEVNTCSFNFPASPVGQTPASLSPLLFQALNLYASQPSAGNDLFLTKRVERFGTTVTISAQNGLELAFPATVPQTISCSMTVPNGMPAMYDCSFVVSELLGAADAQTVSQALESLPDYSKLIKHIKKQANAAGFTKPSTRVWRGIDGEVKEVVTFTSGAPAQMGRIPDSRTMVINGEHVLGSTDPSQMRVTGVYYGMD